MAERAEPQPVDPAKKPVGPSTLAVHGGEPRPKPAHSLTTPIVQTATYTFANTQELKDHFDGKIERVEYGRYGNPTQRIAELKLAALEGAGECLLFASGMGAMTTALFAMLSRGTHVVVTDDSYRRTRQFLNQTLSRYGIEVSTVPAGDYDALEDAIRPTTRVLVSESPTNPYNRILDLERFAAIGRRHRVKTVIDATFATPVQPAAARVGRGRGRALRHQVPGRPQRPAGRRGAGLGRAGGRDPGAAGDHRRDRRSIRRLSPRPRAQDLRAPHGAAERQRPGGGRVPGRAPAHRRRCTTRACPPIPSTRSPASRCAGSAGWSPSRWRAISTRPRRVVDACAIPYIAASLGGVESLIEQPAIMSFYELTSEERLEIGIKDNLIRFAVGIEDADDLIADLAQALDRAFASA